MMIEQIDEVIKKLCHDSGFDIEMAALVVETYLNQTEDILNATYQLIHESEYKGYKDIEGLMHKLKGSSGNVRAAFIMQLALQAETYAQQKDEIRLLSVCEEVSEIIKRYRYMLSEGVII